MLSKKINGRTDLEKVLICCVAVLSLVLVIVFLATLKFHDEINVCVDPECVRASAYVLDTIDETVDPCDDFYAFSCGNFLRDAFATNRPSTMHVLLELTKNQLREIVTGDVGEVPATMRLQREFYRYCMNTTAIEEDEDRTILKVLDDVMGGWPASKNYNWIEGDFNWTNIMVRARRSGVYHQFFLNVEVVAATPESRFTLLIKPPDPREIPSFHWRKESLQSIADIATALGSPSIMLNSDLRKTMDFAEQLQKIVQQHYLAEEDNVTSAESDERLKNATIDDLDHRFIKVDWLRFLRDLTGVDLEGDDPVSFDVEEYFEQLYYLMLRTPKRIQANYMAWAILTEYVDYMSEKIRLKYQDILKFSNRTEPPPEKRSDLCLKSSRELFRNVAEGEYVRRYTTPEKRTAIEEIIGYVKGEFEGSLSRLAWMDEADQRASLEKLHGIREEIGWTEIVFNVSEYDKFHGYDKLSPKENVISLAQMMVKSNFDVYYARLKQNVTEWDVALSAPKLDINAYYLRYKNMLILPAPILQGQIFDARRPQYMNFGSLGTIIGHEYTHGLSREANTGSANDLVWSNRTDLNFSKRTSCINREYDRFKNRTGVTSNETGLEENLADFTGLNVAFRAYRRWSLAHGPEGNLPGVRRTPDQLFWIMASTYMCHEPRLIGERDELFKRDPSHGLPEFRVVGRLRSSREFPRDFGCEPGAEMNPTVKCSVFG